MNGDDRIPRGARLFRRSSWPRLLRGIALALDARKLLLALLGLVLNWAGWSALDRAFADSAGVTPLVFPRLPLGEVRASLEPLRRSAEIVADPLRLPATPLLALFDRQADASRSVHALLATLWGVLIWGLIGGAIARIAVVEVATGQRIGLVSALLFALRQIVPLVATPSIPLLGVALLAVPCSLIGLLYRIPGEVGVTVAGALAPLPLAAGLVMALLLIGLAAGWPLSIASVAAEADDTFDALSRTFSYVYQRPLLYAFYAAIAWLVGAVGFLLVVLVLRVALHLAPWALDFTAPGRLVTAYYGGLAADPPTLAATFHSGWVSLITLLCYGWAYAYVWSAASQIYLLIRRDVDGKSLHDVARAGTAARAA
jgi:hypothetical protein